MKKLKALVCAICLLCATCVAQGPESSIRNEVQRLRSGLSHANDGEIWKDVKPIATEALANCEAALDRGRLSLAVLELARAERVISAATYGEGSSADASAFKERWSKERRQLANYTEASVRSGGWKAPLAIRALEEAARGQVLPTIDAAQAYAPVTEIRYGQYYLGEARGLADFSRAVRAMKFAEAPMSPTVRSIAPELGALQSKANEAFKPPLSRDKHGQFIRLNSTLKIAEELNSAGLYAGAWYEYLAALLQYSTLQAPTVEAAEQSALKARVAAELQKPASSGTDDSLRRLFLEQAEAAVENEKASAADLTKASLILNVVLPGFSELVHGATKSPVPNAPKLVTVTLVRWPYT
jgi:hypothetical protein